MMENELGALDQLIIDKETRDQRDLSAKILRFNWSYVLVQGILGGTVCAVLLAGIFGTFSYSLVPIYLSPSATDLISSLLMIGSAVISLIGCPWLTFAEEQKRLSSLTEQERRARESFVRAVDEVDRANDYLTALKRIAVVAGPERATLGPTPQEIRETAFLRANAMVGLALAKRNLDALLRPALLAEARSDYERLWRERWSMRSR